MRFVDSAWSMDAISPVRWDIRAAQFSPCTCSVGGKAIMMIPGKIGAMIATAVFFHITDTLGDGLEKSFFSPYMILSS